MGRSRGVPHSTDDDPTQSRSKRKRTASTVENSEAAPTGQGTSEGKKPLYHCNYCNKDISGRIRIKCVMCPDFDLCVECFSVGAEVTPHKNNHPYRVMDNLSFPLICPDWNADEEILLLEGIEMYGMGNWAEVAEHVGTKSKAQCIDHYTAVYKCSPCFPLPDMSHVIGKNREELLAMGKEHGDVKKGLPVLGEVTVKEESSLSSRVKVEESRTGPVGRPPSNLAAEPGSGIGPPRNANTPTGAAKKSTSVPHIKDADDIKVEDSQADRSVGEKKPKISGDEGPSLTELSGYNSKRKEFDVEYDNDAEQLLADMEFKDSDTDAERELKLRILHIYLKRLDERKRRKDFILERNLLYPDPFEQSLLPEEKEICKRYRVFMRFNSKEEHENLLKNLIEEHQILKRIQNLQDARAAGCITSAEADRYIEIKRNKEAEENARRLRENGQAGPSGNVLQRPNHPRGDFDGSPLGGMRVTMVPSEPRVNVGQPTSNSLDDWDVSGLQGADLLSETEKRLCGEMRILPTHYLAMMQTLLTEVMNGTISKKSDAYGLFKVEPGKVDRVYDMLVKKGLAQPC